MQCRATKSFSLAATVRIGTTSPRRTSVCIRSASSGRSTARAATSTSSIRKPSNRGYRSGTATPERDRPYRRVVSAGRGRDEEGDVAGHRSDSPALDRRDRAVAVHRLGDLFTGPASSGCAGSLDSVDVRGLTAVDHRWYAIQTTAGHENKVRSLIQRKIEQDTQPAETRAIRQALVPTQEVVEIKNGKKVTVERKIYPGYVLVEMLMTQETLHVINGIQGVIKFVGHDRLPQPLRADEVNRLLGIADEAEQEEPEEEIPFLVGQAVAITEGPFTDFNGTVEEVIADKGKVRVSVSLFGRPTSVELDYLQLKGY